MGGSRSEDTQSQDLDWSDKWGLDSQLKSDNSSRKDERSIEAELTEKARQMCTKKALAALFLMAILFGLLTFFVVRDGQTAEFEAAFDSFAREMADIANNNARNTFGQLKVLSTAITSVAMDRREINFPYVNMPHFDLRTQEIADLTGIEMILFTPFVPRENRSSWERFSVYSQDWILQDYSHRGWDPSNLTAIPSTIHDFNLPDDSRPGFMDDGFMEDVLTQHSYTTDGFSTPIAQYGPRLVNTSGILWDLFTHPVFKKEIISSLEYNVPVISESNKDIQFLLQNIQPPNATDDWDYSILRSFTLHQVKESFDENSRPVGFVIGVVPWHAFFQNMLPEDVHGIVIEVVSDCGDVFTYTISGGEGHMPQEINAHDPKYDAMMHQYQFFWKDHADGDSRHCHFDLHIYPSQEFENSYRDNGPATYALICVMVFIFAAIVLFVYDKRQKGIQNHTLQEKAQAEAIVNSLFPTFVGKRLLAEQQQQQQKLQKSKSNKGSKKLTKRKRSRQFDRTTSRGIAEFLSGETGSLSQKHKPLADLYPFATIMFSDIVGFTAWSSVREPTQVFQLLETLYQNFDKIASRRKIFKVETIGDCYVAVAGLPEARRDHAPAMAMFAKEVLEKFEELVEKLEVELGPDTTELGLRTGLHSGPVTAGVLRGDRARFQLFGDTVNTTARIETTGENGRIHISEECAEELRMFGLEAWVVPRKNKVTAKGKGTLSTSWLEIREDGESGSDEDIPDSNAGDDEERALPVSVPSRRSRLMGSRAKSQFELLDEKNARLIAWNTETLKSLLEAVVNARDRSRPQPNMDEEEVNKKLRKGKMVFDEVAEIIKLPHFDQASADRDEDPVELDTPVVGQIRSFVSTIAKLYPDNPFHNFDHASHVSMSVSKLLSRIVAPKISGNVGAEEQQRKYLHDHTYGITSDPLTQFACVFSALIHDCEHDGVPNAQLVKEENPIAAKYNNISVAEQNSVDLAWDILMSPRYKDLRASIYTTEAEMTRFRQLVVNSVMATDIVDKDLKALRNARWDKAFEKSKVQDRDDDDTGKVQDTDDGDEDDVNRKATIVIEHLIQASDVSHTMQHWHIFSRWNENLFREMYTAYKAGRSENDPSVFWYKGEIGFFDFYIIPLAKKLKECGVFGVSSTEYLNYAIKNRREWEQKGEEIVKQYVANFEEDARAKQKKPIMDRQLSRQISKILSVQNLALSPRSPDPTAARSLGSARSLPVSFGSGRALPTIGRDRSLDSSPPSSPPSMGPGPGTARTQDMPPVPPVGLRARHSLPSAQLPQLSGSSLGIVSESGLSEDESSRTDTENEVEAFEDEHRPKYSNSMPSRPSISSSRDRRKSDDSSDKRVSFGVAATVNPPEQFIDDEVNDSAHPD